MIEDQFEMELTIVTKTGAKKLLEQPNQRIVQYHRQDLEEGLRS